jgi:hypothetical protein
LVNPNVKAKIVNYILNRNNTWLNDITTHLEQIAARQTIIEGLKELESEGAINWIRPKNKGARGSIQPTSEAPRISSELTSASAYSIKSDFYISSQTIANVLVRQGRETYDSGFKFRRLKKSVKKEDVESLFLLKLILDEETTRDLLQTCEEMKMRISTAHGSSSRTFDFNEIWNCVAFLRDLISHRQKVLGNLGPKDRQTHGFRIVLEYDPLNETDRLGMRKQGMFDMFSEWAKMRKGYIVPKDLWDADKGRPVLHSEELDVYTRKWVARMQLTLDDYIRTNRLWAEFEEKYVTISKLLNQYEAETWVKN